MNHVNLYNRTLIELDLYNFRKRLKMGKFHHNKLSIINNVKNLLKHQKKCKVMKNSSKIPKRHLVNFIKTGAF